MIKKNRHYKDQSKAVILEALESYKWYIKYEFVSNQDKIIFVRGVIAGACLDNHNLTSYIEDMLYRILKIKVN